MNQARRGFPIQDMEAEGACVLRETGWYHEQSSLAAAGDVF